MKSLFKKTSTVYKRGFTLIELLVVIAIIGILTAILTTNFTTAKSKSRDAKRISDIAQLQLTLEQVFDRCNKYPKAADYNTTTNTICTVGGVNYSLSSFISNAPKDPSTGARYTYILPTGGTEPFLDYVLQTTLENNNTVLNDAAGTPAGFAVVCSHSSAPYFYCVQPK